MGHVHFRGGSGGFVSPEAQARIAAAFPLWHKQAVTYCVVMQGGDPFNAGLDMGALARLAAHDMPAARRVLATSYRLAWQLDCFTKPTVPLMNGSVSGAGIGHTLYGTHQVAGEGYRLAVTGPRQGWFPDHGLTQVLARLPESVGTYLALTGASLDRADAFALGLLTHCIPAAAFAEIATRLSDADPVDPILDGLHVDPGEGTLARHRDTIARCFAGDSIAEIAARLDLETGSARAWAQAVREELLAAAPTAAAITLELLRRARQGDLREILLRDYRVAARLLASADLAAAGTGGPWAPLDSAVVTAVLAPLGDDELQLATRVEMQAPAI